MREIPVQSIDVRADDGHTWQLLALIPDQAKARLFWLPAMGVAARHYLVFAQELAARGIAVFLHDWRGSGSSSLRPARGIDWGYREVLTRDLPASEAAIARHLDGVPRIVGGHSLGGQLACCHLGLAPESASRLWLVASGSPFWRAFPLRSRWWLPMAYRLLPWLADRRGFLPGHSVGFGGNEARQLIHDWARSALSGRYAAEGLAFDLDTAMRQVIVDVHAVALAEDWMAPASSTRHLLSKLPHSPHRIESLDRHALATRAGHFDWMKQPEAVANSLLRPL